MINIRLGGVPEHFNMPWHYALEKGLFEKEGIALHWSDYPGGTGAMAKDLRSGVLDAAVILTEGIVADIIGGNACTIVQWYVKSPLVWGIHVAASSAITTPAQFAQKKYAISRYGSGSHLMAYVDAYQRKLPLAEDQFVVVGNLQGAADALSEGKADLFMWEKFMTKPYVDKGIFRRIEECPTPWPCFVIAVRNEFLDQHPEKIATLLSVIQEAARQFAALPDAAAQIANRYQLQLADVQEWFRAVQWQTDNLFETAPLREVVKTLFDLKVIETTRPVETFVLGA
jgi:sulfonate transport system substrate-binding protein